MYNADLSLLSSNAGRIVWLAVAILILLFFLQRFGTEKVGYTFAPVLCLWFFSIAGIGIYNFVRYDPTVIRALNPKYIIDYFKRNNKDAWISLGGVVMCITGIHFLPTINLYICAEKRKGKENESFNF